ncbi:MAG TPA: BamA/TamA family outer membrane protein [Gemmatimonadales bacterium]|nr:BamA/TamA family outer membrane protein [Gemmatimonadales bacterium]
MVLLMLACPMAAAAQRPEPMRSDSGPIAGPPDSGKFKITPLLAPAYNPEMQFLIAGGFLLSWKVGNKKQRLLIQRSTLSATVSFSSTGAINVSTVLTSFWAEDRLRILLDLAMKDMPDNYWGVGYDAGLDPGEGDATTEYHRRWFKFNPRILWHQNGHIFLGATMDMNLTHASNVNPTMAADPYYQQYGPEMDNVGFGFVVQYDSRDVAVNAWKGLYLGLTGTFYNRSLGGDNVYQIYLLDYRQYHQLGRKGRTLAWQMKARIGGHDVPWPELSMLGTGYDLRGYVEGRFRDRSTLLGLVEYRQMFVRSDNRLSRWGFVGWAGGGSLGTDLSQLTGFLPNAGLGLRFELQPRANVRADVGFGHNSNGVYFNFTEAF